MSGSVNDGAVIPFPAAECLAEGARPPHAVPQPQKGGQWRGQGRHISVLTAAARVGRAGLRDDRMQLTGSAVNTERLSRLTSLPRLPTGPAKPANQRPMRYEVHSLPTKAVIKCQ